ncbi:MAG: choice-of-anchor D domain-containing protein, partial [Gammaproteobacteria bacterium]|nr:choice-of-anchor D domain-containing protein [Gammaproteobacteria bacterium]
FPALNQNATGACMSGANYWDVGVRGDTSPTNHTVIGFTPILGAPSVNPTLVVNNSILTANPAGYVNGTGNQVPATSPLISQYCNGSRVPPENGGMGYNVPAGRSETTGLSPVFVFNNIQPAATVDEGSNWINLSYGPLALFSSAGQSLIGGALGGPTLGAYSTDPASIAVNTGANEPAPDTDYFGSLRPHNAGNPADIGAVETVFVQRLSAAVSPSPLDFGNWATGTTSAVKNLTVTNTGNTALANLTYTGIGAPFTRVTTGTFPAGQPNCGANLAIGAACTIKIRFAPTAAQSYNGSVTVAAPGATVTPVPVVLSGAGVASRATVSVTPLTITLASPVPSCLSGNTAACSGTGTVTFTNTAGAGGAQIAITNVAVNSGAGSGFLSWFFSLDANTCIGAAVAPGQTCTATVRFTNVLSARGTNRSGTVVFTDNGAGSPQTANLTGYATPPPP